MSSLKVTPVVRVVVLVFLGLWLLFAMMLLLARGPQTSITVVLLISLVLSTVTTLGGFALRWAFIRWEKQQK